MTTDEVCALGLGLAFKKRKGFKNISIPPDCLCFSLVDDQASHHVNSQKNWMVKNNLESTIFTKFRNICSCCNSEIRGVTKHVWGTLYDVKCNSTDLRISSKK